MSRFFGNKEISAVYYGRKIITAVHKGIRLIWQSIKSCFGNGFWDNAQPWDNDEGYKN